MRKKVPSYIKIIFLTILFVLLYGFTHSRWENKLVKEMDIQVKHSDENIFINKNLLAEYLERNSDIPTNGTRKRISTYEIEEKLNKNPFIEKSEVYIDELGSLHIDVEEKRPIARVHSPKKEYYISDKGEKMQLSDLHTAQVILIHGDIKEIDLAGLTQLIHIINADNLLKNAVIGIEKDNSNCFNLLVKYGDYKISLGKLTNMERKLRNFNIFYQQHLKYMEPEQYEKIELKFDRQIVAKKRTI